MDDWLPKLKRYPHWDSDLSPAKIMALVQNPKAVATNPFYPFLRYAKSWQPFRDAVGGRPARKVRPIRYASRRDAYIFAYYRHLLSMAYEPQLARLGLGDAVLAYRKVRDAEGRGKSNIEFARDAFWEVRRLGNCGVVALDVSSFFESLDHAQLEERWARVLGVSKLPADHGAVFKAVTKYAVVDRDAAYERLGFLKRENIFGREHLVPVVGFRDMPRKICSNRDFREKIVGGGASSLVEKNQASFGIPQGSPISDILANLYMLDFDAAMVAKFRPSGATYCRYSDDILVIVPGGEKEALEACEYVKSEIGKYAAGLVIKDSKSSVLVYEPNGECQTYKLVGGVLGKNGLEYLGFRYDGQAVRLRDATVSGLYRKVTSGVHGACAALIARYPGKTLRFLQQAFPFGEFMAKYGRVEDFSEDLEYESWTFWTYANRALKCFGPLGEPIRSQLANYKRIVASRVARELSRRLNKVAGVGP